MGKDGKLAQVQETIKQNQNKESRIRRVHQLLHRHVEGPLLVLLYGLLDSRRL